MCKTNSISLGEHILQNMPFPFVIYSRPHSVNDLEVMQSHLFNGGSRVIEMKGKSRQQDMLGWYFKVIQMNNLKLRSYSFLYVSLQLNVVHHYQ